MKDSIINGTGNSRYLRSSIPEGTTVEQMVSMLRAGTFPVDFNGINAAGWQQIGDALNKANLLSDVTCDALGIAHTSVVNDALLGLAIGAGKYGFAITLHTPGGRPLANQQVAGVTKPNGTAAITDSNGFVLAVSTSATPAISVYTGFADIATYTGTLTSTGVITTVTITMPRNGTAWYAYAGSQNIYLSPDVSTVTVCAVGGGASGAPGRISDNDGSLVAAAGGGGGHGYVSSNIYDNAAHSSLTCAISIGAGGVAVAANQYANGNDGGTSTITLNGTWTVSGAGGKGGKLGQAYPFVGGVGGAGQPAGSSGTGNYVNAVGGAGGYNADYNPYGNGGAGGGGNRDTNTPTASVAGAQGVVYMSWTF